MKSELIKYTDRAIMDILVDHYLQLNPWLRRGDTMTGPTAQFLHGKTPKAPAVVENAVTGLTLPANLLPPKQPEPVIVTSKLYRFDLEDIRTFRSAAFKSAELGLTQVTWIHPYALDIPHRAWLENHDVGDMMVVACTDPTNYIPAFIPLKVTQELIDAHSYVNFRFAFSTHP